jgi:hypothetical protein
MFCHWDEFTSAKMHSFIAVRFSCSNDTVGNLFGYKLLSVAHYHSYNQKY